MLTMTGRALVIGDIHGCWDELQELLDSVPLTSADRIIHIGDLMDRGPYPQQVVEFFRYTPNALSLMGNRDHKHINAYDDGGEYSGSRAVTRYEQFSHDHAYSEAVDYLRTLPDRLELPWAYLVHGYYQAGVAFHNQQSEVVLGHPEGEAVLDADGGFDNWWTRYDGDKPLLMGHREYPFFDYEECVYALDTRCVYGGALTGLLLPDFEVFSVPARQNYYASYAARYNS
jgi:serine/threonine protein phosphatase 1